MSIGFTCPHCGTTTQVSETLIGKSGPCKNCGQTVTVTGQVPVETGQSHVKTGGRSRTGIYVAVLAGVGAMCLCGSPILIALLLPAVQMAREAARRVQCANNLQQIGLAMQMYHKDYGSFPPAFLADEDGRPLHSWRVLLLPYLEAQHLYSQYDFSQPWDSPTNQAMASQIPELLQCPSSSTSIVTSKTSYVVVVCDDDTDLAQLSTMFPGKRALAIRDLHDSTSNTILAVESMDHAVDWLEPKDIAVDQLLQDSTNHPGGFNVVLADGSVRFITTSTDADVLQSLLTPAAGDLEFTFMQDGTLPASND